MLCAAFFIAGALIALPAGAARVTSADQSLEKCLEKNGKLAVLMLIDESKSLRELKDGQSTKLGNDPTDSRVPALSAVVRVLASAVASSQLIANANNRSLEVAIGVAGFGDAYTERLEFRLLNDQSVDGITEVLEAQRERDSDLHTRYHTALEGALTSFDAYSMSPEVCRLLVWFSDGEHDDDNSPGFVSRERDQIQKLMCGDDGIVDKLRGGKVNIVAAGLNPDERKLGLMRLIAQGGSSYETIDTSGRDGRVNVAVSRCGASEPNGKYALAQNADQIIDTLFEVLDTVPGIPNREDSIEIPKAPVGDCPDTSTPCNSVEFEVDENIASFQILAERPSKQVEIRLTTNEGQQYPVLLKAAANEADDESPAVNKNTVQSRPVTARKVLISVTRKKENSIDGTWKLEFFGEGAPEARGTVNFVGIADISLEYDGKAIDGEELKIGRFLAAPLGVRVATKTSGSTIRDLQLQFRSLAGVEPLKVTADELDSALFVVSENELERALQTTNLKKASSTDLSIVPVGDVRGLKLKNGTPVRINFGSKIFGVRVSNGAGLPSFVRTEGILSFEGTPKQKIGLVFKGPDSGDGLVTFGEALEAQGAKANLDIIQREPCLVPQQTEAVCEIELIPDEEAFDQFQVAIAVTYSGKDSAQEPVAGEILLDVTMVRQPSVGRGGLAAVALIAIFLVIQGLVRLLLAFLVSRFAPLVATARRIRIDAVVDSTGGLVLNPMQTNPSHSDEGFALENTESVQSFNVFGYDFAVSVLKTFMRSTVAPVGQVRSPSTYVVGSRGYSRAKDETDSSTGKVSLTLRGQWAVGVKAADFQRLLNGELSVAAEVVAFFEPYEGGIGRDQQLSDLSFGLSASSFATEFVELLEGERERMSKNNEAVVESSVPEFGGIDDPFGSAPATSDDPFGSTVSTVVAVEAKPSGRRKRGRKSRDEQEDVSQVIESSSTTETDPFA